MPLSDVAASPLLVNGAYSSVPGARKLYVRATPMDLSPIPDTARYTTLAAALAACRSGAGDEIHVLPGHSESVAATGGLTGLVAGTRIIGWGQGDAMPTFRWTAAAANWNLNVSGVEISGLRLRLEGFDGVTSAIDVTAADCAIFGCDIETTSGANNRAAIALSVSNAAANRFRFYKNVVRGTAAGASTDCILISAAVSGCEISENKFFATGAVANGLIRITAAALNTLIAKNVLANITALSAACINVGNVAATGLITDNRLSCLDTGAFGAGDGITFGAASLVRVMQNFWANDPNVKGIEAPTTADT